MAEYKTINDIKLDKLEHQLNLQIQINQKLLEVIKMIEPYFIERYDEINKLIESQNR